MGPTKDSAKAPSKNKASTSFDISKHLPEAKESWSKWCTNKKRAFKKGELPDQLQHAINWLSSDGRKLLQGAAPAPAAAASSGWPHFVRQLAFAHSVKDLFNSCLSEQQQAECDREGKKRGQLVAQRLAGLPDDLRAAAIELISCACEELRQPADAVDGKHSMTAVLLRVQLLDVKLELMKADGDSDLRAESMRNAARTDLARFALTALAALDWNNESQFVNVRMEQPPFPHDVSRRLTHAELAAAYRDAWDIYQNHHQQYCNQLPHADAQEVKAQARKPFANYIEAKKYLDDREKKAKVRMQGLGGVWVEPLAQQLAGIETRCQSACAAAACMHASSHTASAKPLPPPSATTRANTGGGTGEA